MHLQLWMIGSLTSSRTFSVLSNPRLSFDDWLASHARAVRWTKIVIPATLKWEVRDKLDQVNLNERTLLGGTRWTMFVASSTLLAPPMTLLVVGRGFGAQSNVMSRAAGSAAVRGCVR